MNISNIERLIHIKVKSDMKILYVNIVINNNYVEYNVNVFIMIYIIYTHIQYNII